MNRLKGLLRDTWWLWAIFFSSGFILGIVASRVFFVTVPLLIVAFVYYGMMRYDDDGNPVGD